MGIRNRKMEVAGTKIYRGPVGIAILDNVWPRIQLVSMAQLKSPLKLTFDI